MGDLISNLTDDILLQILSLLTLREETRCRSLSLRWRDIPNDTRSLLQCDTFNVFGTKKIMYCDDVRLKFVNAVDHILQTYRISERRINVVKIQFGLGCKYGSHIDSWIQEVIKMDAQEFDLNLSGTNWSGRYALSSHLLCTSNLKSLSLEWCTLSLSAGCTSWLRPLTALELCSVPLKQSDLDFIVANALNLTSLSLIDCCLLELNCLLIQLPYLKKLVVLDHLLKVELLCPNLEVFKYSGFGGTVKLSHSPLLREAYVWFCNKVGDSALFLEHISSRAPNLEVLSFRVTTEVQPIPASVVFSCLKQLNLFVHLPLGCDLCNISYILNASPSLEILVLKLRAKPRNCYEERPQRTCRDCPHFKLKEVKINNFRGWHNEVELARYLLENAEALRQMIIVLGENPDPKTKEKALTLMHHGRVSTTAQVLILESSSNS